MKRRRPQRGQTQKYAATPRWSAFPNSRSGSTPPPCFPSAQLVGDTHGHITGPAFGGVEGDDRRLVEDDAAALGEDARVGRAEVDGEVGGEHAGDIHGDTCAHLKIRSHSILGES